MGSLPRGLQAQALRPGRSLWQQGRGLRCLFEEQGLYRRIRSAAKHRQVFTGHDLTPLKPRGVQERLQKLGRLADVPVTPHVLRAGIPLRRT